MVPAASADRMRTESVSEGPLLRERLVACGLPASSLHADLRAAGGARPAPPTIRLGISGLFRPFAPLKVNQLHGFGDDCMSGAFSTTPDAAADQKSRAGWIFASTATTPNVTQEAVAFSRDARTPNAITQANNDGNAASQTQNPIHPRIWIEFRRGSPRINPPASKAQHAPAKHGKRFRDFDANMRTPIRTEIVAKVVVILI